MKIKFLFTILYCMLCGSLAAQPIVKDAISVNGLQVGEHYSQERLVQALGQPTKIVPPQPTDAYEHTYMYYYGENRFYLIDGEFYGFEMNSSDYQVNGIAKVGDSVDVINSLGGIKKCVDMENRINWRPRHDGLYCCTSIDFSYKDNRIISIGAFIQDL